MQLVTEWGRQWRRLARHPLADPTAPPFTRAAVPMFITLTLAALIALGSRASTEFLGQPRFWALVAVILLTEVSAIHVVPEREIVLNDIFYVIPFVVLPVPEAAMLVLVVGLLDPVLHPRPARRARTSTMQAPWASPSWSSSGSRRSASTTTCSFPSPSRSPSVGASRGASTGMITSSSTASSSRSSCRWRSWSRTRMSARGWRSSPCSSPTQRSGG